MTDTIKTIPKRRKSDSEDGHAHAHRRKTDSDEMAYLHVRVNDCEEKIDKLIDSHSAMAVNLNSLTENVGRVAEVLEAMNNAKGFWLTLKFMASVVKVVGPIALFMAAIWAFVKTGQWVTK